MKKHRFEGRDEWADGPWSDEPDRVEWRSLGLPCLINRAPMGNLCGYVAVPPGHPWHGKAYSECVVGCEEIAPRPIQDLPNMKIPESIQEHHMSRKNFPCREEWQPDHTPESIVRVHGGLTYSGFCQESGTICHVPQPGEPDNVWWFGFDCAHAGDLIPSFTRSEFRRMGITAMAGGLGETYKNIAFVRKEVQRLARLLATIGKVKVPH